MPGTLTNLRLSTLSDLDELIAEKYRLTGKFVTRSDIIDELIEFRKSSKKVRVWSESFKVVE